jgi:hypothetical protein
MADMLTRQGARNLTRVMDRVASVFEKHHASLGVDPKVAEDYAKRTDLLTDAVELTAATNYPMGTEPVTAAEVHKTPAADADPEVPKPTAESAGDTDDAPDSDDQNKPETYYGKGANGEKLAAPEWAQPARNETGESVEPGGSSGAGWDPNAIADDRGGPYKQEPDESYMGGHFAQNWFHQLRDKQEAGQVPGVDKFAARMAMAACMSDVTHVAMVGAMSDSDARQAIIELTDIDKSLAELDADIAKAAGMLMKRRDELQADQKSKLKAFGDKLPETIKAQGKVVIELRGVLIEYTKVAAQNPPTVGKMRGGVLEAAGAKFGAEVRDAIDDMWDVVKKERTALKKATARVSYRHASTDKEAGVMDWLAAVSEFFGKIFTALVRVFDMGTTAIESSAKRVNKSFDDYKKAQKVALKDASTTVDASEDDALLRRLLAEEGMDKDEDEDEDGKKAADESDEDASDDEDGKKKADDDSDDDSDDDKKDDDKKEDDSDDSDDDSEDGDDDDDDDEESDKDSKKAATFGFGLFK